MTVKKKTPSWFYGIRGIQFVWHGAYNDPELIWHGQNFNYYDIENPLWDCYMEDCIEAGVEPDNDEFSAWVKKNAYLAREFLQNIVDARRAERRRNATAA